MDRPSSSRMAVASFLASGSIRIVVAGIFDGMAAPFLVYRDATILLSLCGGFGPVVHLGRQDVEHIMDAAPAHAVGELSRDRALGGAGIGRHEGPAPLEPSEVGAEVLRRHALKRLHEGIEERMDGVDPVDGPLGRVLGIVGRVCVDLELREDVDIGGRLVCIGMAVLIGFQGFANIAVATGIFPNTGLPLPFISSGISSLLSIYAGMGIVLNIGLQRKSSNS